MSDSTKNQTLENSTSESHASETKSYKTTLTAIRKARRFTVQGLYEWQMSGNPIHQIEAHTRANNAMHTVHLGYYHELMKEIVNNVATIDGLIEPQIDRQLSELDGVELAVLRIGIYELTHRLEIPFKVVIDEAIQLNSHFGSVDGYKFINAVLDKLALVLRSDETQSASSETNQKSDIQATQTEEDTSSIDE